MYWVDGRHGRLEPPVRGTWDEKSCWLTGSDELNGAPIDVSYAWTDVTDTSASWEQCFSVDGGQTWQPNWQMTWRPRESAPERSDHGRRVTSDFDFLAGAWRVRHRRDAQPMSDDADWQEAVGEQRGWIFFGGSISVDEVELAGPGQRGLTFRIFDPHAERWSIYWVNSRSGKLEVPVSGTFAGGVGTFESVETIEGREVHVRFVWDQITSSSARWRQSFSFDAGRTWRENWQMLLDRTGDVA